MQTIQVRIMVMVRVRVGFSNIHDLLLSVREEETIGNLFFRYELLLINFCK